MVRCHRSGRRRGRPRNHRKSRCTGRVFAPAQCVHPAAAAHPRSARPYDETGFTSDGAWAVYLTCPPASSMCCPMALTYAQRPGSNRRPASLRPACWPPWSAGCGRRRRNSLSCTRVRTRPSWRRGAGRPNWSARIAPRDCRTVRRRDRGRRPGRHGGHRDRPRTDELAVRCWSTRACRRVMTFWASRCAASSVP